MALATLVEWALPLNPPNPYTLFLQDITNERRGKLYYAKYIVDVVGELNIRATVDNVREWRVPALLYPAAWQRGSVRGIAYGPGGRVWIGLQGGHRLVELDQATGMFTAFGANELPIRFPWDLMFDKAGGAWYTGWAPNGGGLIGRLHQNRQNAVYWELPGGYTATGLWVEVTGRFVWFAITGVYGTASPWLGRLERASGDVTYWTPKPVIGGPECRAVVGDRPSQPVNVWFSHLHGGFGGCIYRLHVPTGRVYRYAAATYTTLYDVALEDGGNAWVGHSLIGKVSTIAANANCGGIRFATTTATAIPQTLPVKSRQRSVDPVVSTALPVSRIVPGVTDQCLVHYQLPAAYANSLAVAVNSYPPGPPSIFFTETSLNTIGRLVP